MTLEPPFEIYHDGINISDKNGHVCTAEDAEIAKQLLVLLNGSAKRLLTEDQVMKVITNNFGGKMWDSLTRTEWRDGIDISRPSYAVMHFVNDIAALAASSTNRDRIADAIYTADGLYLSPADSKKAAEAAIRAMPAEPSGNHPFRGDDRDENGNLTTLKKHRRGTAHPQHDRGGTMIDEAALAAWARNWHWNDCADDSHVDPSIYFRDMRMLKAFIEAYNTNHPPQRKETDL